MAKTAVAKKEETSMAVPAFMQEHQGLGTEALGSTDIEIPRIKLMQKLSPELEENNDLKAGDLYHTLAELNFGPSVRITPLYISPKFILWRPRKSGGGILARADDSIHWSPPNAEFQVRLDNGEEVTWRTAPTVEKSGLDKWGSSNPKDPNSPPAATRMYNLVVSFPDEPDLPPAVVTLQRAAIRVARKFIGKLKITRAPSFGLIFNMKSVEDQSPSGKFFNYAFTPEGMVEDKAIYDKNYDMYKFFQEQGVQVKDLEDAQDDQISDDAVDAGKGKPAF